MQVFKVSKIKKMPEKQWYCFMFLNYHFGIKYNTSYLRAMQSYWSIISPTSRYQLVWIFYTKPFPVVWCKAIIRAKVGPCLIEEKRKWDVCQHSIILLETFRLNRLPVHKLYNPNS